MNRILITFICFAIAIGMGVFLVMPGYNEHRDLISDIGNKETELQYYRDYSAKLREISAKLDSYGEAVSKVEDFLPSDFSIPVFYANIQNMASQSGMILTSIGAAGIQSKEGVQERSYELNVAGNYSSFKNFLSVLERSAKLIEVERFNFSAEMVEGEGGSFSLRIKTYSY